MNKNLITSISLLVAGVVTGVVVCVVCLTAFEWQKASKASQMHNQAGRQIAARVGAGTRGGAATQAVNMERNSNQPSGTGSKQASAQKFAGHVSSRSGTPQPVTIGPAARSVIPNILHQAVQTSPVQGQWASSDNAMPAMMPVNTMVWGPGAHQGNATAPASEAAQVMPTTYIIPQPDIQIIVPGKGGPTRAVDSADAIPMPIGANGLQQNPCVDPGSSYGRAYNRGGSY